MQTMNNYIIEQTNIKTQSMATDVMLINDLFLRIMSTFRCMMEIKQTSEEEIDDEEESDK